MKTVLKALLPIALCAASGAYAANSCGGHGQDAYYYDSILKGTQVKITLQGAGSQQLTKLLPNDPDNPLTIGQDFNLASDCSFTSYIYSKDNSGRTNLYAITGTWSYPAESKTIYFALDGDISQGNTLDPDDTTWGRLLTGTLKLPTVMPIIFGTKISGFETITQASTTKTATIVPGKNGTAKATMSITGKGITTNLKGDRKEASFSFTSTVKATESI